MLQQVCCRRHFTFHQRALKLKALKSVRIPVTVVQAACLIFAATYILLNMLADVLGILSNPRLLHPR